MNEPTKDEGYWCQACRETGVYHCGDPFECSGMKVMKRADIDAAAAKLGLTKATPLERDA